MVKNTSFNTNAKLKDFVDKNGHIPDKITKINVCKDIVQLLGSNVSSMQKNQVTLDVFT